MTHMLHVMDIAEMIKAENVALSAVQIDLVHSFSGGTNGYSFLAGSGDQKVHRSPVDTQEGHHQCYTLLHGGVAVIHPDKATKLEGPWKFIYVI